MKECVKKILDKKFESVINGYSPYNVDSFLDSIIVDIEEMDREKENMIASIEKLNEENENLKLENQQLKEKIQSLSEEINDIKNKAIEESKLSE